MGNVILLRLGKQQWRDANLRKISTEMGHDCFMFRKLLCDPAVLVLEMQGYSDKFPLLIMENFLLTSSLQFPLCFQPNQFFPVIGSSVNTGDSCPLQEKLQGEGRNEPLERAWQWLRRSLAQVPLLYSSAVPEGTCGLQGRELHKPCHALSASSCLCSEPSVQRGRRLVLKRTESHAGAVPL